MGTAPLTLPIRTNPRSFPRRAMGHVRLRCGLGTGLVIKLSYEPRPPGLGPGVSLGCIVPSSQVMLPDSLDSLRE